MDSLNKQADSKKITEAVNTIKQRIPGVELKNEEPLKNHTTFKIGGPVRVMFFPDSTDTFIEILNILGEFEISPLIIGNGSNILAADDVHEYVVINTLKLDGILLSENELKVEAGVLLSKLAVFACESGLTGLEFAHGIPGTAGGAVVMNAGAYGAEMKDVVVSTTAYNKENGMYTLTAAENGFSYRHSRFTDTEDIVLSVTLRLQCCDKKEIKQKMDDLYARRRSSQPLELPSGGSTFKRPKEGYAAALIEQAGLKGFAIGDAQVSDKHAGFIVNNNNATFIEAISLIKHVQEEVDKQFGVRLEPEIRIIGKE